MARSGRCRKRYYSSLEALIEKKVLTMHATKGDVYGALLAHQSGREIDIISSFELPPPREGQMDLNYLTTKHEQRK